jgi:hypothetical protein
MLGAVLIILGILNDGLAEMLGVNKKDEDDPAPKHPPRPADRSPND